MKIKFKDVAHLYVGCQIKTKEGIGTFDVYYSPGHIKPKLAKSIGCYGLVKSDWAVNEVKPILRPFSDLSNEDAEVLGWADVDVLKRNFYNDVDLDEFTIREFKYLITNKFDLFGLIESGEAIDKTTLK